MLFTSDGHSIIDREDNEINFPENIIISDHVWIGHAVKILKGSFIARNSVVAMNSLITKI